MSADGAAEPARPRPLYGEYATPEQQRESILRGGGTLPEIEPATPPVTTSAPVPSDAAPPVGAPVPGAAPGAGSDGDDVAQVSRAASLRGDRLVTIALLVYGLYTVVTTIPQLLDVAGFADTWMEMAGIDATFTNYDGAVLWGRIAAVVFAVGWLLTALWAWRWTARGRRAFWIPLVGAVACFVLVSVCLTVPIVGDPALVSAVLSR